MKIGNVPSGEANFTLPTSHWVGPVSRRLRCCNKSSRRLLARARTAACFSGSQRLGAAVGSHPHMRWRAAVGQCLLWWGNPAGSKLPPHKHPFSAIACCDPASSPCEPGRRRALIILFFMFFFFFLSPSKKIFTQVNFLQRFSQPPYVWKKGKETEPSCFWGLYTVVAFQNVLSLSW